MSQTPSKRGRPPGGSSEVTYERIVRAARRIFSERGYAAAQNRAVAELAEMTTSSLYHYFDSKLALYVAVFTEAEALVAERYRVALESPNEPVAAISSVLEAARALYREDPSIPSFLAGVPIEMRNHPEVSEAIAQCEVSTGRVLLDLFETAKNEGALGPGVSAFGLAAVLFASTTGVALFAQTPMGFTYEEMVDALQQLVAGSAFA
ncbi:MAG: TetR/AcrR family transcriptional regulator [Polyangiales bacterium]